MGHLTKELFREIVALSSHGVLVVDVSRPRFRIVYANRAYEELSGFAIDELEGSTWLESAAMDAAAPEYVRLTQMVTEGEPGTIRFPFFRRDGDIWLADLKLIPLTAARTSDALMMVEHVVADGAASSDVETLRQALVQARQSIARLERTDPVTGLLSDTDFRLMLRRELAVSRRDHRSLHLMLFSIPELDIYRQTFGTAAADSCVRMIGAQIAGTFRRASDLSARVGASMLAVAVAGHEEDQIGRLAVQVERKARNLGLHNPRGRLERYVVVQSVVVVADPDADDVDGLMGRAEAALYAREKAPSRKAIRPV